MMKSRGFGVVLVLIGIIAVAAGLFALNRARVRNASDDLTNRFMKCLPEELTDVQREEIRGILDRYNRRAHEDLVDRSDRIEVKTDIGHVVASGSIDMPALNRLMAKIAFYTFKQDSTYNPPDGSGVHPLLNDTTSTTPH